MANPAHYTNWCFLMQVKKPCYLNVDVQQKPQLGEKDLHHTFDINTDGGWSCAIPRCVRVIDQNSPPAWTQECVTCHSITCRKSSMDHHLSNTQAQVKHMWIKSLGISKTTARIKQWMKHGPRCIQCPVCIMLAVTFKQHTMTVIPMPSPLFGFHKTCTMMFKYINQETEQLSKCFVDLCGGGKVSVCVCVWGGGGSQSRRIGKYVQVSLNTENVKIALQTSNKFFYHRHTFQMVVCISTLQLQLWWLGIIHGHDINSLTYISGCIEK